MNPKNTTPIILIIPIPRVSSAASPLPAFTLIEVLIAVAIFAILLAAIDGLLFGAMHLQAKATDAIDAVLPTDQAITVIKRDIAGMVPPSGPICGSVVGGSYAGTNTLNAAGLSGLISLEIYTTTGIVNDDDSWCDVQRVDYSLQNSTNGAVAIGRDLVRCVSHNPLTLTPDIPDQQRLLEAIQKLEVMFFDGTNWVDSWGSPDSGTTTNLPTAIRFRIDFTTERSSAQTKAPLELLLPVPTALVNTNS